MSKYVLPGILNVSTGENNGNDLIGFVYDYEIKNGNWDANLIPFLDINVINILKSSLNLQLNLYSSASQSRVEGESKTSHSLSNTCDKIASTSS